MPREYFVLTIIFFVIGLPIVLGIGSDLFRRWLKHKEKLHEREATLAADIVAAQAAQIERLEQRVRVLERIATDGGASQAAALAAEIERLDAPASRRIELR